MDMRWTRICRTPYVQQWNLSVQREIGWNTSVTVSYVGNKGTKLYRAIDLNQVQINGNGFLQAFNAETEKRIPGTGGNMELSIPVITR